MPNYQERLRQLTRELKAARLELADELERVAEEVPGSDSTEKPLKPKAEGKKVRERTKTKLRHGHSSSRKAP